MRKCIESIAGFHFPLTLLSSILRTVKVLIKEDKCERRSQDILGMTPLHIAVENNNLVIVKLFIKAMDCNGKNDTGKTALHLAAAKGYSM